SSTILNERGESAYAFSFIRYGLVSATRTRRLFKQPGQTLRQSRRGGPRAFAARVNRRSGGGDDASGLIKDDDLSVLELKIARDLCGGRLCGLSFVAQL